MTSEGHNKAPSAIPPRTSSHGLGSSYLSAKKSPPVENEWLAQGKRLSNRAPAQSHSHRHSYPHTHTYPVPMSPPSKDPLKSIADELIFQKQAGWAREKEKILLGPYDYLLGHPGKDIRSRSILAFNAFLRVPTESLEVITQVVGMLHTASLL